MFALSSALLGGCWSFLLPVALGVSRQYSFATPPSQPLSRDTPFLSWLIVLKYSATRRLDLDTLAFSPDLSFGIEFFFFLT